MNRLMIFAFGACLMATAHADKMTIEMHTVDADGVGASLVARLGEQQRVGAHEGDGHRHLSAVGKESIWSIAEGLDRKSVV